MHWAMVGWSHHETPVEVRERLAFTTEQVGEALQRIRSAFPDIESVLLSTCNRVELYCAAREAGSMPSNEDLGRFLTEFHSCPFDDVRSQLLSLSGPESIEHLFRVAASLDSMVVGEAQILSQVKAAYEMACEGKLAAAQMHLAFQRCRSRSQTCQH